MRDVFGAKVLIQRCTLHKRRNIADQLPDKDKAWVDAKLVKAFGHPDPAQGVGQRQKPCRATGEELPRCVRVAA